MADELCAVWGIYHVGSRSALYCYRCGCSTAMRYVEIVEEDIRMDIVFLMTLERRMY